MLTEDSLQHLLDRLGPDPETAGSSLLNFRAKIVQLLKWRGCPESAADDLADVTIDRIAAKLSGGEVIGNLAGFAAAVTRFVWLEYSRKRKEDAVGDDVPEIAVPANVGHDDNADPRMDCLKGCVAETLENPGDRRLILGYYDQDLGEKLKESRKSLAASFGLTVNTLKVRACRLRSRLESCINKCVGAVTEAHNSDTIG